VGANKKHALPKTPVVGSARPPGNGRLRPALGPQFWRLLDAHVDCARLAVLPGRLIISAIAHRFAPLFEVGDLSTEKGDTDIGSLNFRGQPASQLFAGLRF